MAVTASDIATSLGRPLTTAEQAQATQWIADAYMLIEARFGDAYADLAPTLVDYVVRESVAARFRGGTDQASSITVAVDDANVTRRWENSTTGTGSNSWLLGGWAELLDPASESKAFSTRPSFEPDLGECP